MEEAQALEREEKASKKDTIIEKWWLNKMWEVHQRE
jgi:hypothetical protein